MSTGLIAGGSLAGIIIALLVVFERLRQENRFLDLRHPAAEPNFLVPAICAFAVLAVILLTVGLVGKRPIAGETGQRREGRVRRDRGRGSAGLIDRQRGQEPLLHHGDRPARSTTNPDSFVHGGPSYRLALRLGFGQPGARRRVLKVLLLILVTWVPLLLLSLAVGDAFGSHVAVALAPRPGDL